MTQLAQVHGVETGQKGSASTAKIRSSAVGGLPPGSEAAFLADPFALSAPQQPKPHGWLWGGYWVLLQLRSMGELSAK